MVRAYGYTLRLTACLVALLICFWSLPAGRDAQSLLKHRFHFVYLLGASSLVLFLLYGVGKRVGVAAGLAASALAVALLWPFTSTMRLPESFPLAVAGFAAMYPVYRLGKRLSAPDATQLMKKDRRPPILLLRTFDDDQVMATIEKPPSNWIIQRDVESSEQVLTRSLATCGPVIAIRRPGEFASPLGAARSQISNADWKQRVAEWISMSRYIVMVLGDLSAHDGLSWEVSHILECNCPEKIVLVVPPLNKEEAQRRWDQYRTTLSGRLPAFHGDELFVTFSADWTYRVDRVQGTRKPENYATVPFLRSEYLKLPMFRTYAN